jgi:endonuclease YncB( thermonuclease family)
MLNRIAFLFLVCLVPAVALAGVQKRTEVKGFVVNVSDDCMLIVSIDHEAQVVRLAGIAYPQDQGRHLQDAIEFVRSMVMSKKVLIESLGTDPSGNILGRIHIGAICLNDALIQAGLAQPKQP